MFLKWFAGAIRVYFTANGRRQCSFDVGLTSQRVIIAFLALRVLCTFAIVVVARTSTKADHSAVVSRRVFRVASLKAYTAARALFSVFSITIYYGLALFDCFV